jgi:hypothetical protein
MANVYVGIPMVEVVTPDGTKELWAAAMAHDDAVAAVQRAIPADRVARLTNRRLPIGGRLEGIRYGEVRRVEP